MLSGPHLRTRVRIPPPPPFEKRQTVSPANFSETAGFLFPIVFKGFAPVSHLPKPVLQPPDSPSFLSLNSLFAHRFSGIKGRSPKLVRLGNPFYINGLSQPAVSASLETRLWCEKSPEFLNQKSVAGFGKWD